MQTMFGESRPVEADTRSARASTVPMGPNSIRVLIIEDNPADADQVRDALEQTGAMEKLGVDVVHVVRISDALAALSKRPVDVALLDLTLPDASGLSGLRRLHAAHPDLAIVVLTGLEDDRTGAEAVAEGAQDYLVKSQVDPRWLSRSIRYAIGRTLVTERTRQMAEMRLARELAESAERHAALLGSATQAILGDVETEAIVRKTCAWSCREFASACVISLGDGTGHVREFLASCKDPHVIDERFRPIDPSTERGVGSVLERRFVDFMPWIPASADVPAPPGVRAGSAIVLPLERSNRELIGTITFVRESRFTSEDAKLAEEVAHRLAIVLDRAGMHRELQRAVALRDEFLAVAAHELRTPLTSLILFLESARRGGPTLPISEAKLDRAARSAGRLGELIDRLLDVTRLSRGEMALQLDRIDLAELVRGVVERMGPMARDADSDLVLDARIAAVGWWDRIRIEQAVANLVSNAVKFGHGHPVDVSVRVEGSHAYVCVSDQGPGIPDEDMERIFERFQRGAQSSRNYGGLGLGLYVTRTIVEAHGGRVTARNLEGRGARFEIRLPLRAG